MTEPTAESASNGASKECQKQDDKSTKSSNNSAPSSSVMPGKRKMPDQNAGDANASSSSLPSSVVAKRSRSSSSLGSSTSWLQRLYASKSTEVQPPDNISEKDTAASSTKIKANGDDSSSDNDNKNMDLAIKNEGERSNSSSGSGSDDGDDGDDNDGKENKVDSSSSGIWSWFGYGSNTTDASVQERMDKERRRQEQQQPQQQRREGKEDQNLQVKKQEQKDNDEAIDNSSISNATNDSSRSLWRLLFWSSSPSTTAESGNDAKKYSVVVENDPPATQEQQNRKIEKAKEANKDPVSGGNKDQAAEQPSSPKRNKRKNVVLPTIHSQFAPMPESAHAQEASTSLLSKALRSINSMFAPSRTDLSEHPNPKMAKFIQSLKGDPKTIAGKRFVIVGVHGWFPMKLVRSMIGEPTGTSTKFCDQMVLGVTEYFRKVHNLEIPTDSLTTIPLEGEGKVEERVDKLYASLKENNEWMEALMSADVIFWATHSQGTPVSAILLHRLLADNRIDPACQALCLLAMAGIAHGPFPSLKGSLIVKYFEADAARELFEFMDSTSDISQKFRQSLAYILNKGVKTVLVGSMQDQVVPLYSAIMAGASHPSILRAVYIDGHVYSEDDFLINLITFALRLRNAGFSDHGLLTHISEVLAGNLYQWEGGHSTIYEEVGVYELAVQYLFETKPFGDLALPQQQQQHVESSKARENKTATEVMLDHFQAKLRQNPFYLPWAMRGICDDARVLGDKVLSRELEKLRDLFDRWVPSSAKMREIKFRLEPLKARL